MMLKNILPRTVNFVKDKKLDMLKVEQLLLFNLELRQVDDGDVLRNVIFISRQ